jgi:zinc-ribbon domain
MSPLVCPSCHTGHGDDERFCSRCGMPLVLADATEPPLTERRERARKVSPQYAEGELVKVGWARNQAEAELIAGMLLEEGIPSVTRRSGGFDVPDFLAAGPRDILVAASGEDVARDLLKTPVPPPGTPPRRREPTPMWVRGLALLLVVVLVTAVLAGLVSALLA